MSELIYLDYNATTPLRPGVKESLLAHIDHPGNASSVHQHGRSARKTLEQARQQLADLVNANPENIVFNSGATEANNTVLRPYNGEGVFISAIEHPSVMDVPHIKKTIPVTSEGLISLDAFEELVSQSPPPDLISVMMINNETGVIQPIAKMATLCKERGIFMHTDATQAVGRVPVNLEQLDIDYLTCSAHKLGGPQGAGAIIHKKNDPDATPLIYGGGQERNHRAGTENLVAIAGFGSAAEIAGQQLEAFSQLKSFQEKLEQGLKSLAEDIVIFGQKAQRIPNTTCLSIPGIQAETALIHYDLAHIAISSGSACSSGKIARSKTLQAMGASDELIAGALRVSTGWFTQEWHIDRFLEVTETFLKRARN